MRVEITEERLSDTDEETGQHYNQANGDTITVPDKLGQYWCDNGWARDVSGDYPTGERKTTGVIARPEPSKHAAKDTGKKSVRKTGRRG